MLSNAHFCASAAPLERPVVPAMARPGGLCRRAARIVPLALALALGHVGRAHACGGLVLPKHSERVGGMREQEVLVVFQADRTVVLASAGYKGAGDGAAFLLPVRHNPLEVHEASLDVFVALDELTAPQVEIRVESDEEPRAGCRGLPGSAGDGDDEDGDGVMVLQRGTTASYEYEVVGGDTGDDVIDWLTDAGYPLPADYAAAIAPYVDDGYFFLAAKIKPGLADGALPPLEVHLPATEVEAFAIPFGLAAQSLPPGEALNITTYLVAGGGVLPKDDPAAPIDRNALVAESPEQTNYAELYAAAIEDGGWVVDYSAGEFAADRLLEGVASAHASGRAPDASEAAVQEFLDRVPFAGVRLTRIRTTRTAAELHDLTLQKVEGIGVGRTYNATFNAGDGAACTLARTGALDALLVPLLLVLRPRRRRAAR